MGRPARWLLVPLLLAGLSCKDEAPEATETTAPAPAEPAATTAPGGHRPRCGARARCSARRRPGRGLAPPRRDRGGRGAGNPDRGAVALHQHDAGPRSPAGSARAGAWRARPGARTRRRDRLDSPAAIKARPQFVRTDSPRAVTGGFPIAEALQIQLRSGTHHRGQLTDVATAILIGKHMEQPAIEYVVELLVECGQFEGVMLQEGRFDVPLTGLPLRLLDCLSHKVDACHIAAPLGKVQGHLSRTAADIEHFAADLPGNIHKGYKQNAPRRNTDR